MASAKVDKTKLPILHDRLFGDQADFAAQRRHIPLDLVSIHIREDLEVAKLASFAAEWDVKIESEWSRCAVSETRGGREG
jgi:hypothetical protein